MRLLRKISLTSWIFIALVLGILLGVLFPAFAKSLEPISNIFLRLIRSIRTGAVSVENSSDQTNCPVCGLRARSTKYGCPASFIRTAVLVT